MKYAVGRIARAQAQEYKDRSSVPPTVRALRERHPVHHAIDTRHHILVVDDEPAVAQILSRQLENRGYRVTVCTESNGALQCFGSDPAAFDLLITDYHMPGRDGLLLSWDLLEMRPDLPILVCTANPHDLPPPDSWPIGVRALLEKPFSGSQLAQTVAQILPPPPTPGVPAD